MTVTEMRQEENWQGLIQGSLSHLRNICCETSNEVYLKCLFEWLDDLYHN
jgi:hypothetical protein